MIIEHRSAAISYSADSVAQSLRSVTAATTVRRDSRSEAALSVNAKLDLVSLYPNLFVAAQQPSVLVRSVRAGGLALTATATAAATLVAILHS